MGSYLFAALTFFVSVFPSVALASAQSEIQTVEGTAGQDITLSTGVTGLHGDYQITWARGREHHTLINFYKGVLEWCESPRFHVDVQSASLTIQLLSVNDSGLYEGQIINGNGSTHKFNLTVVEAAVSEGPPPTPANITADQRNHLAVIGSAGLVIVSVFVLLAYVVRQKKIKGKRQNNSETA